MDIWLMVSFQDGTTTTRTFVHTPSTIEAEEAEEIGVEHLLRDIRDVAVGTLSTRITNQLESLQGLHLRLQDIGKYLQKVLDGDLPVNHAILANLQDVFNLLPNLTTPKPAGKDLSTLNGVVNGSVGLMGGSAENSDLSRGMSIKTNDELMSVYLSNLIRSINAFHELIDNKIQNKRQQEEEDSKKDGDKKDKDVKKDDKSQVNGTSEKEGKEDEKSKKK